jgi:predicted ester cyclase
MTTEQTRETMTAYAEALLSFGDFARYLSDDVTMTFMGTDRFVTGRDAVRDTIRFFHEVAFSSAIKVSTVLCGDGESLLEAEFIGTHIGEFEGVKPQLKSVRVPYSVAYALANGKITALRLYFPFELLMRQLTENVPVAVAS